MATQPAPRTSANAAAGTSSINGPPNTTPTPSPLPPSQSSDCPIVIGLAAFEAGKRRKQQATAGTDGRPGRSNPTYLGTPRSARFKNLFSATASTPNILEVTNKLYDLIEGAIHLPKKGAEKITIGSESAADIKTLAAHLLEMAESLTNIPSFRNNPFSDIDDGHHIERALAGTNAFGCRVPEDISKKLDKLANDLAEMKHAVTMPTASFSFNTANSTRPTPSYALAASKHAPRQTMQPTPITFRPVHHKKPPPAAPQATRSTNTVTLAQSVKDGKELASINYPTLIGLINTKLGEAKVKVSPSDDKPIQIRSVHRHPSNDLVLYTTTPQQAEALRRQCKLWLPKVSTHLEVHNPIHSVVVHGIPATFLPSDPQNIDMLVAMNPETLDPAPAFIKWVSPNATHRGVSHSLIRIGFTDADQARKAVEQKIFFGRYNKKTEFDRKTKPRCMNCLQEGHTSTHCKETMMCPYCSDAHPADACELKGKTTSNCTACARLKKSTNSDLDLKLLFSTTPKDLSHSPLDPTCPTRVAEKLARAAAASGKSPSQAPNRPTEGTNVTPQRQIGRAPAHSHQETAARPLNKDTAMVVNP